MRKLLKAQPEEELSRIEKLVMHSRELEKEINGLKEKLISKTGGEEDLLIIKGVSVIIKRLDGMDSKALRTVIDNAKNRLKSGVVVVGSLLQNKVLIVAGVTKDLTHRFHAGDIVKSIAGIVGGSGGGRPDMAQAGGIKQEMLNKALEKAREVISKQV